MRLLDLTVRRIRRHRELQLRFDPQLTLIGGANESGKSTLVEALHKGLFLKASATGRGVEELRSRLHPGLPEVEIGFAAAGQQWRLRKRFAGSSATCQLSHSGGLNLSGAAAEEELARLLGVEAPVEGRRIAQLPLRWAHLWVRQGEAGSNLLAAPGEGYDLARLIDQLQRGDGADAALESPLDRRVIEALQGQVDQLFTATGRVRAGSPLALARQRSDQARADLEEALALRDQLETSLEALGSCEQRLLQLEQQQAPRLEQLQRMRAERQLRLAELTPLQQRRQQQRQLSGELEQLRDQQQRQSTEQRQLEQQSGERQQQLAALQQQIDTANQRVQQLERQLAERADERQLAQVLLDQRQLEHESAQRQQHQRDFEQLQRQAEALKAELAALAPIDTTELATLRQIALQLTQAEARLSASATGVELLAADLTVLLDGQPLARGERAELLQSGELRVGQGVRLRISPGGGEAPQQARQHWQACRQALQAALERLRINDLAEAELLAGQRQQLEGELRRLRQSAATIPWARLQQQQAAQLQRQQRLRLALQPHAARLETLRAQGEIPDGQEGLEHWRDQLDGQARDLEQQRGTAQQQLQQARLGHERLDREQRQLEQRLQQLRGSLGGIEERRQQLEQQHGDSRRLEQQRLELEHELEQRQQVLTVLETRLAAAGSEGDDPESSLRLLQAEKDSLLTRRGQEQQRILGLSSQDPAALVEQRQAELEQAEAELQRLELQAGALRLLLERFEQERRQLAQGYSQPLSRAVDRYLAALGCDGYEPGLDFDPGRGFGNLRLRQGGEGFGFDELSGGMREQLNGALRLAIAEVLQPAYDGCLPLIFDDAFTNSDPERQAGLRRMLVQARSQGLQIVLLSCTPDLYAPLLEGGGQRLRLEP